MKLHTIALVSALTAAAGAAWGASTPSAGEAGWLEGRGMGMARAAEINGYPGPMHVLELAEQLQLSATQIEQTEALMQAMKADARRLGAELVAAERDLERLFAQKLARVETMRPMLERVTALRGAIRGLHLETHLAQEKLLDPVQIDEYMRLRRDAHLQTGQRHDKHPHHH